jgi:hypothetical protein
MISRRNFFSAALGLTVTVVAPPLASLSAFDEAAELATLQLTPEIIEFERFVRSNPTIFSWVTHNELRHQYLTISEKMSMKHADIILQNSPMDGYMMSILGEWNVEQNPPQLDKAIASLLANSEKFSMFQHLHIACLLKAADLYRKSGMEVEAQQLYKRVINRIEMSFDRVPTLTPYLTAAQFNLYA